MTRGANSRRRKTADGTRLGDGNRAGDRWLVLSEGGVRQSRSNIINFIILAAAHEELPEELPEGLPSVPEGFPSVQAELTMRQRGSQSCLSSN